MLAICNAIIKAGYVFRTGYVSAGTGFEGEAAYFYAQIATSQFVFNNLARGSEHADTPRYGIDYINGVGKTMEDALTHVVEKWNATATGDAVKIFLEATAEDLHLPTTRMMKPVININGTSAETLVEDRNEVLEQLRAAYDAMRALAPHGRDYPNADFAKDREIHMARCAELHAILEEIQAETFVLAGHLDN